MTVFGQPSRTRAGEIGLDSLRIKMWRSSSNYNTPKMTRGAARINFKVCSIYRSTLLLGFIMRSHNAMGFPFILSRSGHALVLALFIHVVAGMALQNITLTLP